MKTGKIGAVGFVVAVTTILFAAGPDAGRLNDDVPDPDSVRAYRDYWSALEEYEATASADGQSKL